MIKWITKKIINFIDKEKAKMSISLRVVQDADGNDVGVSLPNYGQFSKDQVKAFAAEGERVLSNHPEMVPLFQMGAILEVSIREPHPTHKYCTVYLGLQVAGVVNKDKKDTRRDYGLMGIGHSGKVETSHCSFDVRLRRTGVLG